jgi:putative endonuclease
VADRWQSWRRLLDWLKSRFRPALGSRRARGQHGEELAARHLRSKGFRILERNYTVRRGEIDLVMFHHGTIVFVEVRSLTAPARMDPVLTITPPKQQRVIRAAQQYMATRNRRRDVGMRFDVVTVVMSEDGRPLEVRHIPDAFHDGRRGFS